MNSRRGKCVTLDFRGSNAKERGNITSNCPRVNKKGWGPGWTAEHTRRLHSWLDPQHGKEEKEEEGKNKGRQTNQANSSQCVHYQTKNFYLECILKLLKSARKQLKTCKISE